IVSGSTGSLKVSVSVEGARASRTPSAGLLAIRLAWAQAAEGNSAAASSHHHTAHARPLTNGDSLSGFQANHRRRRTQLVGAALPRGRDFDPAFDTPFALLHHRKVEGLPRLVRKPDDQTERVVEIVRQRTAAPGNFITDIRDGFAMWTLRRRVELS